MSDIAEFLAAQRAGSAEPRIEWYEAGASGSVRCKVSLDSGAWTLERRSAAGTGSTTGILPPEEAEALRALAALVKQEDDPGGPGLSSSGLEELLVALGGTEVNVRGGESEGFPDRPEAVVRALNRLIPDFDAYGRPETSG